MNQEKYSFSVEFDKKKNAVSMSLLNFLHEIMITLPHFAGSTPPPSVNFKVRLSYYTTNIPSIVDK